MFCCRSPSPSSSLQSFSQDRFAGSKDLRPLDLSNSFLLLLVRHLLLEALHLFLVANIVSTSVLVTTSKALVTRSVALVPSSEHCFY